MTADLCAAPGASDCRSLRSDELANLRHIIQTLALAALALLLSACTALGGSGVPDVELRAQRLNETIMCPVCPGESI